MVQTKRSFSIVWVVPIIALLIGGGLAWLLADQLNFLLPLLIWSLAGDEFNVAEGRKNTAQLRMLYVEPAARGRRRIRFEVRVRLHVV